MSKRFLLLVGIGLTLGCGGSRYAPVSGTVTLDGKALPNVVVTFQPIGDGQLNPGPGSSARTNDRGEFSLTVIGGTEHGAVVGWHQVQILPTVEGADDDKRKTPPKLKLLPKYNAQSTLKFEVKPGQNTANFDLVSK
jgi:hypothetical protein